MDIYLQKCCKTKTSIQGEFLPKQSKATFEATKESNVGNWSSDKDDKISHFFHWDEEIISELECRDSEF